MTRTLLPLALLLASAPVLAQKAGPASKIPAKPEITLLDQGGEPRQKLRYRFVKGQKQRVFMDMQTEIKVKVGDFAMPMPQLPMMRLPLTLTVDAVDEEGTMQGTILIEKIEIIAPKDKKTDDRVLKALKSQLDKVGEIKGSLRISVRGVTEQAKLKLPKSMPSSVLQTMGRVKQQLQALSLVLPEEPVGVGAKWQLRRPIQMPQMKYSRITDCQLGALHDASAQLDLTMQFKAEKQALKTVGMPTGTEAFLESLVGQGKGTMRLLLDRVIPFGTAKITMKLKTVTKMGTREQKVSTDMTSKAHIHPAKKAAN
ncbi:MAG: hypothetical protein CSA62_09310 [Planctomycetota bacterium]|nr:MAG: hypothetical protein CSA62_09310 [Planctomycetota bacterium]